MRKHWKTILGILLLLGVGFGIAFQQFIDVMVNGVADSSGPQEMMPTTTNNLPKLTTDSDDWPRWRGPNIDGKSATTGINTDWSKGLKKLWEVNYLCSGKRSETWSAPVIQGNRLVVMGRNETDDLLFCINPESGKLIWQSSYPAKAKNSYGTGARATPFIDGERIYTFGRSGDLVCWSLYDGKLIWRKNVNDEGGKTPRWGHSATPLVHNHQVIVQGGGVARVLAYNKLTGALIWKNGNGEAGYAASILFTNGDQEEILVFHGEGLSSHAPADGNELWQIPWATDYHVNATTPLVDGSTIFITSAYKMGGRALTVKGTQVETLWKTKTFASHHSDPILLDGYFYGYSGQSKQNKGHFKCVELKTGTEKWSSGAAGWGTMIYVDGHFICLDIKGNLHLIKPSPDAFQKIASINGILPGAKNPTWTKPIVANGRLFLRYRQRLLCYGLVSMGK
ncbi:hypothetical protein BVY04_04085 [bacterium M21]|nr:hypothetical protein BVY04_04085 [bacterium M21]